MEWGAFSMLSNVLVEECDVVEGKYFAYIYNPSRIKTLLHMTQKNTAQQLQNVNNLICNQLIILKKNNQP